MTVTPTTPQTIEGVTVSEPNANNVCAVRMPGGAMYWWGAAYTRAMGLTVPEPTVPCRIGDQEFTLTREQVERVAKWLLNSRGSVSYVIGAAARAHLDADSEAGR